MWLKQCQGLPETDELTVFRFAYLLEELLNGLTVLRVCVLAERLLKRGKNGKCLLLKILLLNVCFVNFLYQMTHQGEIGVVKLFRVQDFSNDILN